MQVNVPIFSGGAVRSQVLNEMVAALARRDAGGMLMVHAEDSTIIDKIADTELFTPVGRA